MESYGFHDIMTFKSNHIQKLNGSEAVYLGGKRGKTLQGLSDLVVWGGLINPMLALHQNCIS